MRETVLIANNTRLDWYFAERMDYYDMVQTYAVTPWPGRETIL